MLQACDMGELAQQVEGDLPNVATFAGEQFAADDDPLPSDPVQMTFSVALATQSLVEGYELGYLEAFKGEAQNDQTCGTVAKVYDNYLKQKAK